MKKLLINYHWWQSLIDITNNASNFPKQPGSSTKIKGIVPVYPVPTSTSRIFDWCTIHESRKYRTLKRTRQIAAIIYPQKWRHIGAKTAEIRVGIISRKIIAASTLNSNPWGGSIIFKFRTGHREYEIWFSSRWFDEDRGETRGPASFCSAPITIWRNFDDNLYRAGARGAPPRCALNSWINFLPVRDRFNSRSRARYRLREQLRNPATLQTINSTLTQSMTTSTFFSPAPVFPFLLFCLWHRSSRRVGCIARAPLRHFYF